MKTYLSYAMVLGVLQCIAPKENESISTSHFTVQDVRYIIQTAGIVDFGENAALYDGHRTALIFISDGVTFETNLENRLTLLGKGALFGLVLYLPTKLGVAEGDYFVNLRPPYAKGDIGIGFYTLYFDEPNATVPYFDTQGEGLLSGKLTVTNNENVTRLTLSMITAQGLSFDADFSGKFIEFRYPIQPN